jgi:uncharacterized protein (TIGR00251 family)
VVADERLGSYTLLERTATTGRGFASAMLDLEPHADGTILPVRAQPGARRNEIRGVQDGQLKVCVTQSPERGKANKALIEVLSKSLKLKKSQIELISGETSHQKRFVVHGLTPQELIARIQPRLPADEHDP